MVRIIPCPNRLFPESPFRKNLNTAQIAANSRFFSDCYNRDQDGNCFESFIIFAPAVRRRATLPVIFRTAGFARAKGAVNQCRIVAPLQRATGGLGRPPVVGSSRCPNATLVSLAAQESRDFQLIVLDRVAHRRLPAVLVEALWGRPWREGALGVLRH